MPLNVSFAEAQAQFRADISMLEERGIFLPGVESYVTNQFAGNFGLAMDAQPALVTTPNSGIPSWLTTLIDPDVIDVLFAPNNAAKILGENRKGSWLDETAMFPIVEQVGEVSSYGDHNENGHASVNENWPQRQSYLFQTVKEYGEREMERAGLGRISWAAQIDKAAATVLNKFQNLTYCYGVKGLQNYGLMNDPALAAPLSPAIKAAGGVAWITNGAITATANEIFADIQAIFEELVSNTGGLVDMQNKLVLGMAPTTQVALTATNTFGINVYDLLKKNFPNIRFETMVQYGMKSIGNPQGIVGGNFVQMIAEDIEGEASGYCSFNEKMRSHPVIRMLSAFKQKVTSGTWGAIIRRPMAFAAMIGV